MDTRMIDVAIGLVLAFAVGSLLLTTFQEIISTTFNGRGKNLRLAITSLMGDDKTLTDALFNQPLMVSLSKQPAKGEQRAPSYIGSDVFVTSLLALIAEGNGGKRAPTPADMIRQLQARLPAFNEKLLGSLAALAVGVESDWPTYEKRLAGWYDAVGERSIGWFKRSTQTQLYFYALFLAAAINMNPIIIVDSLWNDAALRTSTVAQAELALHAYQAENGIPLTPSSLPPAAPEKPKSNPNIRAVEEEIAAIALKLKAGEAVTGTGPVAAAQIKENFEKAEAVAQLPLLLDKERQPSGTERQQAGVSAEINSLAEKLSASSASKKLATLIASEREHRNATVTEKECKDSKDPSMQRLCRTLDQIGAFKKTGLPLGWTWDNWPQMFSLKCKNTNDKEPVKCTSEHKLDNLVSGGWGNLPFALMGWALSALAMTLGAPFWFDLLAKLIKIRGSGAKPEANAKPTEPSASAALTTPSAAAAPASPAPITLVPPTASLDAMSDAEKALTRDEILLIQRQLAMPMPYSGRLDLATREQIALWQAKRNTASTGILTAAEVTALLNAAAIKEDEAYAA